MIDIRVSRKELCYHFFYASAYANIPTGDKNFSGTIFHARYAKLFLFLFSKWRRVVKKPRIIQTF